MDISASLIQFFSTEQGLEWCRTATRLFSEERIEDHMTNMASLRRLIPHQSPEVYSALTEIALARHKARSMGNWTQDGLFTRQSIEQATSPEIAMHHASFFSSCHHVMEICTGAGFDTAALARTARQVTSIEANPALAEMARHNLALQGIKNVEILDGTAENILSHINCSIFDGLWSDPSRRTEYGTRIHNPEDYRPPLPFLMTLPIQGIKGIKISPAASLDNTTLHVSTPPWTRLWTATEQECREQVLWSLPETLSLQDGTISLHRVTHPFPLLFVPPQSFPTAITPNASLPTHLDALYLVEPHPALIRSGYLTTWYQQYGISLLDEHIAYGWYHEDDALFLPQELHTRFAVVAMFPYNQKKLQHAITERAWNTRTEIKKRGFPEEPEVLRKRLRFASPQTSPYYGTIILTRIGNTHWCFLCSRS